MLEPVGPLSQKTYWIRRIAVVVVAVVVLLLVVWTVLGRGADSSTPTNAPAPTTSIAPMTGELAASTGGTSSAGIASAAGSAPAGTTQSATPPGTGSSAAPSPGPETAPTTTADATGIPAPAEGLDAAAAQSAAQAQAAAESAAAQAAADAAAAQAAAEAAAAQAAAQVAEAARPRDAEGRLLCPDTAIKLTATVGSPTYNVGEQPIVGVTVVNAGTEPCVRDVSGSLQEYLAYDAAGTRLWSTNDCLPGEGTDVRFLQPGQSLQYNIRWSGTTSQPGCAAERTRVPAGEYRIEARLGGLVSSQASLTLH